jgi:CDP-diacylglycerol--serine O-phosphatidyltransferase
VTIVVMSLLLVSEIPLFSLKFKSFGWKGNQIRYQFLLISLIFIIVFQVWALALIVFLYLVLSIIENYVLKTKKHEI